MSGIPSALFAVIGGSASLNSGFPEGYRGVEVITRDEVYETPFGPTAPFTHARVSGREFLSVPFHGITWEIPNTEPNSAAERVFYVLWKAGVRKIVGTALCGSTNRLLDPGDAVVPDGFVDYTAKRAQSLFLSLSAKGAEHERVSYRLHQAFCPDLSRVLYESALRAGYPRVFRRGVVGVAEGPRLETPDEVRVRYSNAGIDVVTMNLVPEVIFAREIGACYACLELVSNYGEGLVSTDWEGREAFDEFQKRWSRPTAQALLDAVASCPEGDSCGCRSHRWATAIG